MIEDHPVTAVLALKSIIAKIRGIAKQGLLDTIKNAFTCFTGFVHLNKPIIVLPK